VAITSAEIGLLGGGVRTAACTALDHVELVRISGEDFRVTWSSFFPALELGSKRLPPSGGAANQQRMQMVHNVPIDQFLSQGLMEAQSFADSGSAKTARDATLA